MSEPNVRSSLGFRRRLLVRFLTAMIFSVLVGQVFEMGYAREWPLIARMKQEGADVGMALATWWNDLAFADGGRVRLPAGTTHISLLDIDEKACSALASFTRCRFDRIGQPEVLDAAIAAADSARPRIVVLDIYPPTSAMIANSPAGQKLLQRLEGPGAPIVAPIEFRDPAGGASDKGAIAIDWSNSICGKPRCGRLVYAPAFTIERFQSARSYPTVVRADLVPTTDAPSQAIAYDVPIKSLALAAVDPAKARKIGPVLPILYTLPSFATASPEVRRLQRARYFNSVDYDRLRVGAGPRPEPISLADRVPGGILIIGSSAPIVDDLHDSPLGPMTGMEIVANAIRTIELQAGAAIDKDGLERKVRAMTVLGWLGMAATLAGLGLVERARARAAGPAPVSSRLFDRFSFITLAILPLGLFFELGLKLAEVVVRLHDARARTADLDIVFPVLAIFFTTGVEFSQRFLLKLEHGLNRLLGRVGAGAAALSRWGRALSRPASRPRAAPPSSPDSP